MSNYTTFKVIKIIDEYSIVINGGLSQDISLSDDIEVFLKGDEVFDPFNDNKSLGTLDFVKETLRVTEIYPYFSVCEKIIQEEVYVDSPSTWDKQISNIIGSMGQFQKRQKVTKERRAPIKINQDEVTGRKSTVDIISIGDDARIALLS